MNADVRILVADDDETIAWLWERLLSWGFGAEVVTVFDGSSAVARVDAERFDLIITDLQMPGATGLEVLRHAGARDVPVVVATADAPDDVLATVIRLGARAIIRKPFDLDAAVTLARDVLSSPRGGPMDE